jgi:hypothetical protein
MQNNQNHQQNQHICAFCNKSIEQQQMLLKDLDLPLKTSAEILSSSSIVYNNKLYHKSCLEKFYPQIIKNNFTDLISLPLPEFKLSDLIFFHNDLEENITKPSSVTKQILNTLKSTICNHNVDYILCANPDCKKLILRSLAITGEKTKLLQSLLLKQQSESQISPDDKDYQKNGKGYRVFHFCSIQCDGYFSSKIRSNLESLVKLYNSKISETEDRMNRTISAYESSETRTKEEKEKIKKLLDSQRRVKLSQLNTECVKEVGKVVKSILG